MNKRALIEAVNARAFPFTDGALRTYTGKRYKLIVPVSNKAGVHNEYTEM